MKGVLDSIELQMLRRADYLPTWFPTQNEILTMFHSCKHVTLHGCYTVSYSLLSLAFTTQWNPKHPSYISIQLFCKSMKRSTWMWKSNFVKSIDNLASLESWDIQEFMFISFNFTKKDWGDFFKIEYEGLATVKDLVFLVVLFEISFRRQFFLMLIELGN